MTDDATTMHAANPATEWLAGGTELGRHRVVGKLSEGAHAIVYLGEHVQTRAEVAIKVLRSTCARSPEMLARFDREAIVMGRLAGSRTVVHVHDAGELADGRRYLVMELVRGRELSTMLANVVRRGIPLELDRVVALASDIAGALRDAHGKNVVHRDLKPSNVMIVREPDGRETAKLVDFGVSGDRDDRAGTGDLTMTGSVIGTPEYMAPEQAVGLPAAPSMDLFALGVLLFEMTTGALPPRAALRAGTVPPMSTLRPGVPAELDALVRDLLALDPKRRPEDAIAVLTRLDGVRTRVRATSGPNAWAEGRPVRAAGAIESGGDDEATTVAEVVPLRPAAASPTPVVAPARAAKRRGPAPAQVAAIAGAFVLLVAGTAALVFLLRVRVEPPSDAAEHAPAVAASASELAPSLDEDVDASTSTAHVEAEAVAAAPPRVPEPTAALREPERSTSESVATSPSRSGGAPRKPIARASKPAAAVTPVAADRECDDERTQAEHASAALRWNAVLEHTRTSACWPDARARLRLRTEALAELGRFESCVREGGSSSDAAVQRIVELCTKRIDDG